MVRTSGDQLHPGRNLVALVQDVVVGAGEDGSAPELVLAVTDEVRGEDHAREDGADRQQQQRHEHDPRALVRLQRTVVAMIVVRVSSCVTVRLGMGLHLGVRGVIVSMVVRVRVPCFVLPHWGLLWKVMKISRHE
jgi:hypothetical protein